MVVIQNNTKKIDGKEFKNGLGDENYPARRKGQNKKYGVRTLIILKECDDFSQLKNFLEILTVNRGENIYYVDSGQIGALEEWLREKEIIANHERIIEEKNGENIHEDFGNSKGVGFGYGIKKYGERLYFNYEQVKAGIKAGFCPQLHFDLATYLRGKGIAPQPGLNLEQLDSEHIAWVRGVKKAQDYLNYLYPLEVRKAIEAMNLSSQDLIGALDLSDFSQLKKLIVDENCKLDLLNISNNPHLTHLKINSKLFTENRIIGLEETLLVRFRLFIYNLGNESPKNIGNVLVKSQQAIFPEMELIDINDLNELVSQIPTADAEDAEKEKFLKKFGFKKISDVAKRKIKNEYHVFALKKLIKNVVARCINVRRRLLEKEKEQIFEGGGMWWGAKEGTEEESLSPPFTSYKTSQELTKKVLFGEDIELLKLLQDLEYLNPKYKIPNDTTYFTQGIDNLKQEGKVRRILEKKLKEKEEKNEELENELQIEREEFEKALQKSQEGRERQLKIITDQKDQEIEILKKQITQLESQPQQAQIEIGTK